MIILNNRIDILFGVAAAAAFAFAAGCADTPVPTVRSEVLVLVPDTILRLTAPKGEPIVDPIATEFLPEGSLLIADRSERTFWVYSSAGQLAGRISGAGHDAGELQTLYGAALIAGHIAAYDVNTASITRFNRSGELLATWIPDHPRDAPPRTIRTYDDTLLLLTLHPRLRERSALVFIIDSAGRERTRAHRAGNYYRTNGALFSVLSMPIADARQGTILAGFSGSDSLSAYNLDGDLIAAGSLGRNLAFPVVNYSDHQPPGRHLTREDLPVLTRTLRAEERVILSHIVMIDSSTAVLQLDYLPDEGQKRRAFYDAAVFVPVRIDRERHQINIGTPHSIAGRLVGRDSRRGGVLILRAGGNHHEVELLTMRVESAS